VNEEIRRLKALAEQARKEMRAKFETAVRIRPEQYGYFIAWHEHDDARETMEALERQLDQAIDEYWDENVDTPGERWFEVIAGSGFGYRMALYKLENDVLILKDPGEHDNLAGNSLVLEAEGLTPEDAKTFIRQENESAESFRCQRYDGCHACTWKIDIVERFAVPRRFTKENEK